MQQRLAHIGVDMPRKTAEPGFDSVYAFADAGKAEIVDDPLKNAGFVVSALPVFVPYRNGCCEVAKPT